MVAVTAPSVTDAAASTAGGAPPMIVAASHTTTSASVTTADTVLTGKGDAQPAHCVLLRMHAESFRLLGYAIFWCMIILCVIISKATVDESVFTNNPLIRIFGYNNICVYLDLEPARVVGALLWSFAESCLLAYCLLNGLSWWFLYKQSKLAKWKITAVMALMLTQVVLLLGFRIVFVENPAVDGMAAHTTPFLCLQWALCFICLENHWYNQYSDRFPSVPRWLEWCYVLLLLGFTITKQVFTISAIRGTPAWCTLGEACEHGARVAQAIDVVWMLLAALAPAVIAFFARKQTSPLALAITLESSGTLLDAHGLGLGIQLTTTTTTTSTKVKVAAATSAPAPMNEVEAFSLPATAAATNSAASTRSVALTIHHG